MILKSKARTGPCSGRKYCAVECGGNAAEQNQGERETTNHEHTRRLLGAGLELRRIAPEPLELIEAAGLRVKQVDHEVHEVEQHPPSTR